MRIRRREVWKRLGRPPGSRGRRPVVKIALPKAAGNDYATAMTKLLEQAFEKAQALPAEMQDQIARMYLTQTYVASLINC